MSFDAIVQSGNLLKILLVINIISFAAYGLDKLFASARMWRIPEATLLLLALAGGGAGCLLGMFAFHHKVRKSIFLFCVPLFTLVWVAVLFYLLLTGKL